MESLGLEFDEPTGTQFPRCGLSWPQDRPTFSGRGGSLSCVNLMMERDSRGEQKTDLPALAARFLQGRDDALEPLLRELSPMVVRIARLLAGSGTWVAEDAAQEALIDISQGIRNLRDPMAVRSWAIRVVTARVAKVLRRERVRAYAIVPELRPPALDGEGGQVLAAIHQAFYELPIGMRSVAILRLYLGLSEADTAQALDCSVGTVKSQLHEARRHLIPRLEAFGIRPTTRAEGSENG